MPCVYRLRADDAVADGCSVPLAHVGERLAFTVCLAVRVGAAVERVASVADALNGCVAVAELTCHDEAVADVEDAVEVVLVDLDSPPGCLVNEVGDFVAVEARAGADPQFIHDCERDVVFLLPRVVWYERELVFSSFRGCSPHDAGLIDADAGVFCKVCCADNVRRERLRVDADVCIGDCGATRGVSLELDDARTLIHAVNHHGLVELDDGGRCHAASLSLW